MIFKNINIEYEKIPADSPPRERRIKTKSDNGDHLNEVKKVFNTHFKAIKTDTNILTNSAWKYYFKMLEAMPSDAERLQHLQNEILEQENAHQTILINVGDGD